MSFETWAAFVAASAILVVIPGPTILLVVSYALGQGWRTALPMAVGVALGDFTAMTLSMLGIGALLAASATVFTVLKVIGAGYLIYLGIKLFRAGGALRAEPRTDAVSSAKMTAHAWLVTALNPKSITFFVAFLPQFLDRHGDFWTQMLIFETTFLALAFANAFGYALVAARARNVVRNPKAILISTALAARCWSAPVSPPWRCARGIEAGFPGYSRRPGLEATIAGVGAAPQLPADILIPYSDGISVEVAASLFLPVHGEKCPAGQ
jgi:threonine/homoserine/homoserine lactone efflux protein